jgi:ketosteroid isomerase-like protein
MNEQENVQAVQQLYATFGRGDSSALLSGFADDVDWHVTGPVNIPICGSRRGHEGVAQFFKALGETLETQQFEPQEFIAQSNKVVVLGHERHRVKSTGRIFEGNWVQVFTLSQGKVVRFREYIDTAALATAFHDA